MRRSKWAKIKSGSSILTTLLSLMVCPPSSFAQTDLKYNSPLRIVEYSVTSGDTLSKIAENYHTNMSVLKDLNNLSETNILRIGQDIRVIPNCSFTHAIPYDVKSGDTIWDISQTFHTSMEAIVPAQSKDSAAILKPGTRVFALKTENTVNSPEVVTAVAPSSNLLPKGAPVAYIKSMICTLTAYGPGYESTGKNPGDPGYGITASGTVARENETVAVDPSIIPLGSLIYIEGLGYRKAQDTGGAIKGNHIDVFFADDHQALKFGVKKAIKVFWVK